LFCSCERIADVDPVLRMPDPLHLFLDQLPTPLGQMMLVADDGARLRVAFFTDDEARVRRQLDKLYGAGGVVLEHAHNPQGLTDALASYFAGDLHAIDDIAVESAGTPFQREVWRALRTIPCGATTSYGKIAEQIGRPDAMRAVGHANGSNPIAVVVPCHRVIGANGSLTGYGGGIERKRWLLNHERTPTLF
jgi:methylated-DNA-[protein]-cysteine S-methyltransferase